MKKPFDAVDYILPDEVLDTDHQDLILPVSLEESARNRIVQKALTKVEQQPADSSGSLPAQKKKHSRKWVAALVAAVFLMITSVTVTAEVLGWDYRVSNWFHTSSNEMVTYQGLNFPVTESVSSKGVTVDFGTAISDGYSLYLPVTIVAPETIPQNHYASFIEPQITIDGKTTNDDGEMIGCQIFYPPFYPVEVRNGHYPVIIKIPDSEAPLNQKKVEIRLDGIFFTSDTREICYSPFDEEGNIALDSGAIVIDGTWKASFTVPDQSQYVKELTPQTTIRFFPYEPTIDDKIDEYNRPFEVTIESIRFSPISFNIVVSIPAENSGNCYPDSIGSFYHLKIRLKDGTIYSVNELAYWPRKLVGDNQVIVGCGITSTIPAQPGDEKAFTEIQFDLQKLIDINEVEAILIDDYVFPIK